MRHGPVSQPRHLERHHPTAPADLLRALVNLRHSHGPLRSLRTFSSVPFVVAVALFAAFYVTYARSYFFLFDDFALVGEASRATWAAVISEPLFGFYRPVLFIVTKFVSQWAGWRDPAAYALTLSSVHLVNTFGVIALARLLGLPLVGAAISGSLFLLSPWSSEATLWVSGGFDVLATCGTLIALVAALRLRSTIPLRPAMGWLLVGLSASLVGIFAKESAVVLPALVVAVWLLRGDTLHDLRSMRRVAFLSGIVVALGSYLVVRANVMALFGGTYGELGPLFANAPLAGNYRQYWYAAIHPPMPPSTVARALTLMPFMLIIVPGAIAWLVWRRRSFGIIAAACFTLSMLPSAWMPPEIGVTNQSRLMYLPGVWITLMLAAVLADWWHAAQSRATQLAALVAICLVLATAVVSAAFQRDAWLTASRVSASVIRQLAVLTHTRSRVRIPNYPTRCAEGPRIHQSYALRYYYAESALPPLTIEANVITCTGEVGRVVRPAEESTQAFASGEEEAVIPIRLP